MTKVRFLQLNIQKKKHLEKVFQFIKEGDFDLLLLQEIYEEDAKEWAEKLGYHTYVAKYTHQDKDTVVIFSKLPFVDKEEYYLMAREMEYSSGPGYEFSLLRANIEVDGKEVVLLSAHLPVHYPGDEVSEYQMVCYKKLKPLLDSFPEFLFTGDFNTPRGTFIFDDMTTYMTDNIPKEVTTTLDPELHKVGKLFEYVVDAVFTKGGYVVQDVKLFEGLSDHKGITGVLTV